MFGVLNFLDEILSLFNIFSVGLNVLFNLAGILILCAAAQFVLSWMFHSTRCDCCVIYCAFRSARSARGLLAEIRLLNFLKIFLAFDIYKLRKLRLNFSGDLSLWLNLYNRLWVFLGWRLDDWSLNNLSFQKLFLFYLIKFLSCLLFLLELFVFGCQFFFFSLFLLVKSGLLLFMVF